MRLEASVYIAQTQNTINMAISTMLGSVSMDIENACLLQFIHLLQKGLRGVYSTRTLKLYHK